MIAHRNIRWFGFIAASALIHAGALAWVEFSTGGVSRVGATIRVLLASGGDEARSEQNAERAWKPLAATRTRDLFARGTPAAAEEPDRQTLPAPAQSEAKQDRLVAAAPKPVQSPTPQARPVEPANTGPASSKAPAPAAKAPDTKETAETGIDADPAPGAGAVAAVVPEEGARPGPAGAPAASKRPAAEAGKRELLALLHQAINQNKRYPTLARRQRREGTATVRFRLSPSGEMDAVDIDRSSGFSALDTAAVSAVSRVAPFAPARTFLSEATRFKVDVTFRLN
ncbi:MAG: TonB family protein [Gammaproteobacteria bacterium]|nr:TonB family protein [Gammaproteobacteria bacterium]